MDTNMLGLKELYDVQLKATYKMEVAGTIIEIGEPIAVFESVQFGSVDELKERINATGGYNNQVWVSWDTTKEVQFNFTQGVFSRIHLAILGNNEMTKSSSIDVPKMENLEIGDDLTTTLAHTPIVETLFIYNSETGEKILDYTVNDNIVTFSSGAYTEIKVVYNFLYTNGAQNIVVGRRLIDGFMELSGKTRLKDDETGQTYTGIIQIPKLKLMSDLSIRLGKDAPPVVGNFKTVGYPVGSKGNEKVMDFILLNDDIDSDM